MSRLQKFHTFLSEPVDAASLIFFRFCFGIFMIYFAFLHVHLSWMEQFFIEPQFNFGYYGLEWVQPLSPTFMYLCLIALGVSGFFIAFGWFYRVGVAGCFVVLLYFLLSEPAYYQNHIYLILLLCTLCFFIPLNCSNSLDRGTDTEESTNKLPRLYRWMLCFQFGIVYLHGGIAKTEYDWFNCQPIAAQFQHLTDLVILGPYMNLPVVILAATYGVLVFEYVLVPLLVWRKTRPYAFAAAVSFHVATAFFWVLDIFPWFMIAGITVFFSPDWPRKVGLMRPLDAEENPSQQDDATRDSRTTVSKPLLVGAAIFCLFQVFFPFKHHLYRDKPGWNEWGRDFTWRMKLDGIATTDIRFRVHTGNQVKTINPREHLTNLQYFELRRKPLFVYQYAQFLARKNETVFGKPRVTAHFKKSLNGRPMQYLVDPTVDLASAEIGWFVPDWVLPLRGDIRDSASCLSMTLKNPFA